MDHELEKDNKKKKLEYEKKK